MDKVMLMGNGDYTACHEYLEGHEIVERSTTRRERLWAQPIYAIVAVHYIPSWGSSHLAEAVELPVGKDGRG